MGISFNGTGFGFMIAALAILVMTGSIYNNLINNGFTNTQAYTAPNGNTCISLNCPAYNSTNVCGTQTNCQQGSLNIFNPTSPFTAFFTGNLNQIGTDLSAPSSSSLATSQPFAYFSNATNTNNLTPNDTGTTVFAICLNVNGTNWVGPNSGHGGSNQPLQCDQIFTNSTQVPAKLNGNFYSKVFANTTGLGTPASPTGSLNCTSFNSSTSGGSVAGTGYVYYGCSSKYPYPPQAKFMIVAVNSTAEALAATTTGGIDVYAWVLLTDQSPTTYVKSNTQNPTYCALVVGYGGTFISGTIEPTPLCLSWGNALRQTITNAGSGGQGLFGSLVAFGFIAGIVFLIIGLGIGLNVQIFTTGFGLTPNSQGTRLAQVLGLGLVVFSPLYSEFGAWTLPNVIGAFSVIFILLLFGTFFFGMYQQFTGPGTAGS